MKLGGGVPVLCHEFVIVSYSPIFIGIGPYYECWVREDYVVYHYSFLCDPLEDLYPEL